MNGRQDIPDGNLPGSPDRDPQPDTGANSTRLRPFSLA